MFNPPWARPIGSKQFERHLAELMEKGIESRKEMRTYIPELPTVPRIDPTDGPRRYDPITEGYKALSLAILAQALCDYLEEYEHRLLLEDDGRKDLAYAHECRCLTMENEFFRKDEDGSAILDLVLRYVVHNWEDRYLRHRIERMRRVRGRLSKLIHAPLD